jgi:hypothetical protein
MCCAIKWVRKARIASAWGPTGLSTETIAGEKPNEGLRSSPLTGSGLVALVMSEVRVSLMPFTPI